MKAIATLADELFRRDAYGLTVRFVPFGKRGIQLKIHSLHRIAPNVFLGRRAELLCESDGIHRSLGCTILAPEGAARYGLEYCFTIQLDEPDRFNEIVFAGSQSSIRVIRLLVGGQRYYGQNVHFLCSGGS